MIDTCFTSRTALLECLVQGAIKPDEPIYFFSPDTRLGQHEFLLEVVQDVNSANARSLNAYLRIVGIADDFRARRAVYGHELEGAPLEDGVTPIDLERWAREVVAVLRRDGHDVPDYTRAAARGSAYHWVRHITVHAGITVMD